MKSLPFDRLIDRSIAQVERGVTHLCSAHLSTADKFDIRLDIIVSCTVCHHQITNEILIEKKTIKRRAEREGEREKRNRNLNRGVGICLCSNRREEWKGERERRSYFFIDVYYSKVNHTRDIGDLLGIV